MFDSDPAALDPGLILTAAEETTRSLNLLEARKLDLACTWAHAHTATASTTVLPGTEQLIQLGGDGTPAIAEFAPAEFGAVCAESPHRAKLLIADALDLHHRHPVLWRRVLDGQVKAWIAAQIVRTTRDHPRDVAAQVDQLIAPYADRKTAGELVTITQAHLIRLDPEHAHDRAQAARTAEGVWVDPSTDAGTKTMFIRAQAADVIRLDATIDRIADDLAILGNDSNKDQRRAAAIGVLAHPQMALDLRSQAQSLATGQPVEQPTPGTAFPSTTLYVHLTDETLTTGEGVARVEGIGPVLMSQVRDWVSNDKITVKPVIDLNNQTPVDAYEIPDRLREAVHLTSPNDVFPYAVNKTRRTDIDHTQPFDDTGPPGQTRIGNLAPLTRFHHRIKTHSGWQMKQPFPGITIWRSPHGHHYLVDHTGTRQLPAT